VRDTVEPLLPAPNHHRINRERQRTRECLHRRDSVTMRSRLTAAFEEVPGVRVVGEGDRKDAALFAIERVRPISWSWT